MLCKKPFRQGIAEYGCGQCMPCRVRRRMMWTARITLESLNHDANCFATLTYDDDHLPEDGSVSVRDYQLFLKRLRKSVSPRRVRYFFVGEYGDYSFRPHYHCALFGVGLNDRDVIESSWTNGFVHLGTLEPESAGYIVSYVTKRMTSPEDPRLNGRYPEFARMSLKPGIGYDAIPIIAAALSSDSGSKAMAQTLDVPAMLRIQGRRYQLGKYLRAALVDHLGYDSKSLLEEYMQRLLSETELDIEINGYDAKEVKRKHHSEVAEKRNKLNKSRKFGRSL